MRGTSNMSMDWYDMIAIRNGGYKSDAVYEVVGRSGENVFEERLVELIKTSESVLDAGCGHGEFTLKMAQFSKKIVGFDNSKELIKIANQLKSDTMMNHLKFVLAGTNDEEGLPFHKESFDLIYTRRGPTSILHHTHLLKPNGIIFGIHSASKEVVEKRLQESGLKDVEIEVFDEAVRIFPNERELEKCISASHGSLDYSLKENEEAFQKLVEEHRINGVIQMKEWRYIWKARK